MNTSLFTVQKMSDLIFRFSSVSFVYRSDDFTFTLTDEEGLTDTAAITFTVFEGNIPPTIVQSIRTHANWTQNEDFGSFTMNFLTYATDPTIHKPNYIGAYLELTQHLSRFQTQRTMFSHSIQWQTSLEQPRSSCSYRMENIQ